MNKLTQLKLALFRAVKHDKKLCAEIDQILYSFIAEYTQRRTTDNLVIDRINRERFLEYENQYLAAQLGAELVKEKIVQLELIKDEDGISPAWYGQTIMQAKLWVLK